MVFGHIHGHFTGLPGMGHFYYSDKSHNSPMESTVQM